eukprot:4695965-Amphidinium_carterae.1
MSGDDLYLFIAFMTDKTSPGVKVTGASLGGTPGPRGTSVAEKVKLPELPSKCRSQCDVQMHSTWAGSRTMVGGVSSGGEGSTRACPCRGRVLPLKSLIKAKQRRGFFQWAAMSSQIELFHLHLSPRSSLRVDFASSSVCVWRAILTSASLFSIAGWLIRAEGSNCLSSQQGMPSGSTRTCRCCNLRSGESCCIRDQVSLCIHCLMGCDRRGLVAFKRPAACLKMVSSVWAGDSAASCWRVASQLPTAAVAVVTGCDGIENAPLHGPWYLHAVPDHSAKSGKEQSRFGRCEVPLELSVGASKSYDLHPCAVCCRTPWSGAAVLERIPQHERNLLGIYRRRGQ